MHMNNSTVRPLIDRFEVEIQIVDHCNLKCDNCNHFANIAAPWIMSKEEFIFNITKIKEELLPYGLQKIMLVGGEPLLHPQIEEFCKELKHMFPENVDLCLLTNGILLQERHNLLNQYVHISATPYPDITTPSEVKNGFMHSRLLFTTNPVNEKGISEASYFHCEKYAMPMFFIRDYKLFACPFSGCIHIYNQHFNKNIPLCKDDYIDMYELTYANLVSFMDKGPGQICKYCDENTAHVYWNKNQFNELKDYQGLSWQQMFLIDYERYNVLYNGAKILQNYPYWDQIDSIYGEDMLQYSKSRMNAELDIIVPIYNLEQDYLSYLLGQLYKQQGIEHYHIYIISDNSPCEEEIVTSVTPYVNTWHNITLLKTPRRSGPGAARQLGLDNAFSPYCFFLDSDDDIVNYTFFYDALEMLKTDEFDIICGNTAIQNFDNGDLENNWVNNQEDIFRQDLHCLMYNRNFIKGCRFIEIFISEDADWGHQLYCRDPRVGYIDTLTYIYRKCSPVNIGKESTGPIDFVLHRMYVESLNSRNDRIKSFSLLLHGDSLESYLDVVEDEIICDLALLVFYFSYLFYQNLSISEKVEYDNHQEHTRDSFSDVLYQKIITNDLVFYRKGHVFKSLEDYESLLQEYIEKSAFKERLRECMYEITNK